MRPRHHGKRGHAEGHRTDRIAWLRAAVLGANDGIVSTASLIIGVATAHGTHDAVLIAGIAALVAGAMSMAAGEYVSVHSQADIENAELERERIEIADNSEGEHKELATIYVRRGLDPALAHQVAQQLMAHDALGAHARDELGIHDSTAAKPLQAAFASAGSFSIGALLPLLVAVLLPPPMIVWSVALSSLVFLAVLGALSARAGGANVRTGIVRVTFWGALAMAVTAAVGTLAGTLG